MTTPLIITGDKEFVSVVEQTMIASGQSCVFTDSLFHAAQLLQNGMNPPLIVVDLSAEQSVAFVQQVKSHARFGMIPLLAVTQDPSLPEVGEAMKAGANRWLTKGFAGTSLMALMRQYAPI